MKRLLLATLLTACTSTAPAEVPAVAVVDAVACTTCKQDGRCTLTGRGCIAANAQDCRPSRLCWNEGKCDADMGRCVSTFVRLIRLHGYG